MKNRYKFIIASAVTIGLACNYAVIKDLKAMNTKNNMELDLLQNKINDLCEETNVLNEENNGLKIKMENLTQENNNLQEMNESLNNEINEMMKEVSYDPNDLTKLSGSTDYHIKKMLKYTSMDCLSDSFIGVEDKYGINVMFIISLIANESAWNTSYAANTYNNLSGFAHHNGSTKGKSFNSKEECILATSNLIKRDYINTEGKYYNGKSIYGVNRKYSQLDNGQPNPVWAKTINSIASDLVKKANKTRVK